MLSVLLLTGLAQAESWVDHYSSSTYPEFSSILGTDGWETGYDEDEWYGYDGWTVFPTTDDNLSDSGGTLGSGHPSGVSVGCLASHA